MVDTWGEDTVACPYCGDRMKRTVARDQIELMGEHCYSCFLPFEIEADGRALGQYGERATVTTRKTFCKT
jgi:hypothetical protein